MRVSPLIAVEAEGCFSITEERMCYHLETQLGDMESNSFSTALYFRGSPNLTYGNKCSVY